MSVKVHEAYCLDSQQDRLLWWDDFLGDQIQDEWNSAGNPGGSAVVVDQQTGGIVRITTDIHASDDWEINWNTIRTLRVDKKISLEYRLKLARTTGILHISALQFDVNNRIRFYYDTGAAHNTWRIQCRDGGVGGVFDTGVAPDTSYHIFRIECHTHGGSHAHFYIDGTETANSPITANLPDGAGDYLEPRFFLRTLIDSATSQDIDYVVVRQEI